MDLNGTHRFAAAPRVVWDALHNNALLQSSIPGATEVTWTGERAVLVLLDLNLGPFKGEGGAQGDVAESTPPSHLKIVFSRQGPRSTGTGTLTIDLAPDGTGTRLTYSGNASLEGRIAALDNPVTRPLVEHQLNQVFGRLDAQIK